LADDTPVSGDVDSVVNSATGCTPTVTVGLGKREDHSLNAGLAAPPNRISDRVWLDTNRNGFQDAGESGPSGLPVKLHRADGSEAANTTTGADGRYRFDNPPDGTYQVCFDPKTFPAAYSGYQWAKPHAGASAMDSDVDLGTGCTHA